MEIQLFSNFLLKEKTLSLSQNQIRSNQIIKLLSYLICHRNKDSTVQELTEILWPGNESNNPAGALKNLMYRLRSLLTKAFGNREFIITGKGSYQWNPSIPLHVDAEKFEKLCFRARKTQNERQKILYAKEAIHLYQGTFLTEFSNEYWIASLSIYYHSLFLSTVKDLAALMESGKQFKEIELLCQRALELDSLDEELHSFLLKAYIGEGKHRIAAEHYQKTVHLLYNHLGVTPSKELQNIHSEMMKLLHHQETDLHTIQNDLCEISRMQGAFYCEYGTFKKVYELEIRRAKRTGTPACLFLITLSMKGNLYSDSRESRSILSKGMSQMQEVLLRSLRSGDVITRYSPIQFLVILPACPYDHIPKVTERINNHFYALKKYANLAVQYSLEPLHLN